MYIFFMILFCVTDKCLGKETQDLVCMAPYNSLDLLIELGTCGILSALSNYPFLDVLLMWTGLLFFGVETGDYLGNTYEPGSYCLNEVYTGDFEQCDIRAYSGVYVLVRCISGSDNVNLAQCWLMFQKDWSYSRHGVSFLYNSGWAVLGLCKGDSPTSPLYQARYSAPFRVVDLCLKFYIVYILKLSIGLKFFKTIVLFYLLAVYTIMEVPSCKLICMCIVKCADFYVSWSDLSFIVKAISQTGMMCWCIRKVQIKSLGYNFAFYTAWSLQKYNGFNRNRLSRQTVVNWVWFL
jgi:hypothetical protein